MGAVACWMICTPTAATGAIAVFQIEGEIDAVLTRLGLGGLQPGQVRRRSLCGVDDGLVVRWDERTLHLMPHGGAEVQRALANALTAAGIMPASAADRTIYPEACGPFEAAMLHTLARAASPLAIELLLDQPRRWREAGVQEIGEEGTGAGRPRPEPVGPWAPGVLNRLVNPPLVVALGPSNIGKSTLVNALAGRAVSIVADEPGTTRDHVGVTLDLDGLVVRYADTPGLRAGASGAEKEAVAIAMDLARTADLVLRCGDCTAPPPPMEGISDALTVALRCDLGVPGWGHDAGVCAPRGEGVTGLVALVRERLVPASALADRRPWAFWTAVT